MRRLRRAFLPDRLHEFLALLAQNALHATDGVALAVEQVTNAAQQIHIVGTVIAPAAAALHRLDFAETAFPKPQHVLRQIEFVRDFTDGAKCVRRLVSKAASLLADERDYTRDSKRCGALFHVAHGFIESDYHVKDRASRLRAFGFVGDQ